MSNWLFDEVMPNTEPHAFKVVCAVYRKTGCFGKFSDVISIAQFMEMLGTKSKGTAIKAVNDAVASGYIKREKDGFGYRYRTQMSPETGLESVKEVSPETGLSPESEPELSPENGLNRGTENGLSPENGHTIISNIYTKATALMNHFTQQTAFDPPHDTTDGYRDGWLKPAEAILKVSDGNIEQAKLRVDYGLQVARGKNGQGKRYAYKNLESIKTAALNWQLGASENGNGRREPADMLEGV